MKVLVTGANGYLGQGIVKELLNNSVEVIAVDKSIEFIDKRAKVILSDIFNEEKSFEEYGKPDVLLHLAWRDGFEHFSMNHILDLPKHFCFLQRMIASGLKQVCVLGSMHEIGFYEGSIDEYTACNPQSLYGIAKNSLRQSIELLQKNTSFVFQWIRAYYIVGNTEYGNSIFSKLAQAEKNGEKKFPFTKGINQFDFIDYGLFCKQVSAVVCQSEVNGIINCCSGYPERLSERVERFIIENNYKIKLDYGAFPDRPYDSKAVWGNDEKINRIMVDYL